jgi:glycosyltransferase involved in cell wall biosynthesis
MGADARLLEPRSIEASRPLRVLMTADTIGGVWQYALELSRELCARGDEVALATMGGEPSDHQRAETAEISGLTLYPSAYKLAWMEQPWNDVERAGEWLLNLAAQWRPDVVHLNDYSHGDLPWTAPVLMVGHSCVLSWWRAVHGTDAPDSWARYHQRVRAGLRAADFVVAPSQSMLDALVRHYGPLLESRVIANGRSDGDRSANGEYAAKEEALIFAAGRLWDPAKNLGALAKVAERLPWPVCIAGSQRHPDGGEVQLPHVHLLGSLPSTEVRRWLEHAPIYALPARYEPFGLSVLEAALAGCALVLGDIPSLREVWGRAALYVPPDDHDLLERTLRRLIDHPEERAEYAARARRRAARYRREKMADRYRRLYLELTGSSRESTLPPQPLALRAAAGASL